MSPYYVVDILCLTVTLGMIVSLMGQNDDLSRLFRWDSWSIVFMCLSEFIMSVASVEGYRRIVQFSLALFICCASCMSYIWFFYVSHRLNSGFRLKRKVYTITNMLLICFFCFVLWASGREIFIVVGRSGRLYLGSHFLLLMSCGLLFSTVAMIICLKTYFGVREYKLRKIAAFICFLTLSDVISALVQYYTHLPVICIFATISMLYYFISVQESRISLDSLTRLNNRSRLDLFFRENFIGGISRHTESFLLFIDVDNFKSINDSYGHSEGDKALKIVADSLRSADYGLKAFNSRISGDEFVTIITVSDSEEVDNYIQRLRAAILSRCSEIHDPYDLRISVGYARIPSKCNDILEVMKVAEEKMYLDKRKVTDAA
ncbi:MAG: GGDEF domain-containing protein [Succinivibrio sp.]|nr:GGDEF domain-containing protein [Succinivibrio sp.]